MTIRLAVASLSSGALTVVIVEAVKPPRDARFWRTFTVLFGPIGLTILIVGGILHVRDWLKRGGAPV